MVTSRVSQSLRMMVVLLGIGLMVVTSGCSSIHKPAKKVVDEPQVVTPPAKVEVPENVAPEGPRPGDLKEFPPESGVSNVYFDYDKATVKASQVKALDKNLAFFKANPDVKIMIEGHCDERGTVEYNFALGQRRAAAIQEYLLKNGIAAERLATISKGKEQPADPGKTEAAWAKNRRAHFMRMY